MAMVTIKERRMGMRVIGDSSQEIEKKIICPFCGALIGYLPIDVKRGSHTDYSGQTDAHNTIICPKCFITIEVE